MNQLKYRNLTEDDKRQICDWSYAGEYKLYNLPSYDVMKAQQQGFMNPKREKNYFAFLDDDVLVGFVNILEEDTIRLRLACSDTAISLSVADNGVGLSAEKLRELEEKPHYMESTDERLDLRHGLGLLLVRQIVEAHGGTMKIESTPQSGYKTILAFQKSIS